MFDNPVFAEGWQDPSGEIAGICLFTDGWWSQEGGPPPPPTTTVGLEWSIAEARDRMAILGSPFGAVSALSSEDAQYAIHLNDFLIEVAARIDSTTWTDTGILTLIDDPAGLRLVYDHTTAQFRLTVGATTASSNILDPSVTGWPVRLVVYADRDGSAYFHVNGTPAGDDDISAEAATDLTSDYLHVGGRLGPFYDSLAVLQYARLAVLTPGTFPTEAERKAIDAERFVNPDLESPTLLARVNYAAEQRVRVTFDDVDQAGGTVPNEGTGPDLAIGAGLAWCNVRTQHQLAAVSTPDQDWYTFLGGYYAAATADLGCTPGCYISEIIYKDIATRPGDMDLWKYSAGADAERIQGYREDEADYYVSLRTSGVDHALALYRKGWPAYARHGLHVVHQVYDLVTGEYVILVNGQRVHTTVPATPLDLSGDVYIQLGGAHATDGIAAMRLWNPAALPTAWLAEHRRRVPHPWGRSVLLGDANLKGEWLLGANAQSAGSLVVRNQVNPGVGDLVIQPVGATFGEARTLLLQATVTIL